MKTEISPRHYWYTFRGLLDVSDIVKTSDQFLDEMFVYEFTKQISPQIANILEEKIGRIKRFEQDIFFNQDHNVPNFIHENDELFFKVLLSIRRESRNIWIKCTSKKGIKIDPRKYDLESELKFELAYTIPPSVKKCAYSYLLDYAKKAENSKYFLDLYSKMVNQETFDEWIEFFKKLIRMSLYDIVDW